MDVNVTHEFQTWYEELDAPHDDAVYRAVELLETRGITLDFPYSSAIQGSRYALRELRIKSSGHALRVLYAFDPQRNAVLLLGGDKTGDDRFYATAIPRAEGLWEAYLAEIAEEERVRKT